MVSLGHATIEIVNCKVLWSQAVKAAL